MENLDTDVPPPAAAVEATRAAVGEDDANSWLPFNGRNDLKAAVVEYVERRGGPRYDPRELSDLASRAQIYNGLVASGFAQIGTRVALSLGDDDVAAATGEWQLRRNETLRQLEDLPVVSPHARGQRCSIEALGIAPAELSARLLDHKVAATPMKGWGGENAARHLRFVFSNEPVDRLGLLGERVRAALG
jgi:aspartate/methionine/tyrosine aminotransferase